MRLSILSICFCLNKFSFFTNVMNFQLVICCLQCVCGAGKPIYYYVTQPGTSTEHQGLTEQQRGGSKSSCSQHGWDVLSQWSPQGVCMAQVGGEGKWSGFEMGGRVARGFSSSANFEMKIWFLLIYHTFTSMSLFTKFSPPGIPCLLYSYFSNLLLFKTHLFQCLLQLF